MRDWFDCDLINQTAEFLTNVNFVLIGPDEAVSDRLDKRHNSTCLVKRIIKIFQNFFTTLIWGLFHSTVLNIRDW